MPQPSPLGNEAPETIDRWIDRWIDIRDVNLVEKLRLK